MHTNQDRNAADTEHINIITRSVKQVAFRCLSTCSLGNNNEVVSNLKKSHYCKTRAKFSGFARWPCCHHSDSSTVPMLVWTPESAGLQRLIVNRPLVLNLQTHRTSQHWGIGQGCILCHCRLMHVKMSRGLGVLSHVICPFMTALQCLPSYKKVLNMSSPPTNQIWQLGE